MIKRLTTILCGLLALVTAAGCHLTASTIPNHEPMKKLETLKSVALDQRGTAFTVISTGCTEAKDFSLEISRDSNDATTIAIYRLHPDFCRRAPMPITLHLPWGETRPDLTKPVRIINPVSDAEAR